MFLHSLPELIDNLCAAVVVVVTVIHVLLYAVVIVAEAQALLFPKGTRHHFLLYKEFLEKPVTDAQRQVAADEVHEYYTRPGIVSHLRLRREECIHNGVDDRAQILIGCFWVTLEQFLGLQQVVFPIFFKKAWRQVLDQVLVLFFPVLCVTALPCKTTKWQKVWGNTNRRMWGTWRNQDRLET